MVDINFRVQKYIIFPNNVTFCQIFCGYPIIS